MRYAFESCIFLSAKILVHKEALHDYTHTKMIWGDVRMRGLIQNQILAK